MTLVNIIKDADYQNIFQALHEASIENYPKYIWKYTVSYPWCNVDDLC